MRKSMSMLIFTQVLLVPSGCLSVCLLEILDFGVSDSSRVLILRGGILTSVGNFPESLSQAILVGRISVVRLGLSVRLLEIPAPELRVRNSNSNSNSKSNSNSNSDSNSDSNSNSSGNSSNSSNNNNSISS